jgi:hypothetical protein
LLGEGEGGGGGLGGFPSPTGVERSLPTLQGTTKKGNKKYYPTRKIIFPQVDPLEGESLCSGRRRREHGTEPGRQTRAREGLAGSHVPEKASGWQSLVAHSFTEGDVAALEEMLVSQSEAEREMATQKFFT